MIDLHIKVAKEFIEEQLDLTSEPFTLNKIALFAIPEGVCYEEMEAAVNQMASDNKITILEKRDLIWDYLIQKV